MALNLMKNVIAQQNNWKATLMHPKEASNLRNYLSIVFNQQEFLNANYSTAATALEHSEISYNQAKPASEIPGPKSYPIIGSALALLMRKDLDKKRFHIFWKNIINEYGPIVRIKFPGQAPMILISRPEDFETVYRATMHNPIRIGPVSLKKIRDDAVDNYFEKRTGLLPENNEEWWRVRSRVQTPMMKPKNIVRYLPKMDEVSLDFMDRIADFQKEYNEMPENFQEELYKWALESVGLVALNRRLMCLQPNLPKDSMQMKLIKSVSDIFANMDKTELSFRSWRWFPTPSFRKLTKAHDSFLKIADANIRETEASLREKGKVSDEGELTLMESLLMTDGLTRKDVVTLILDMLFAGIDTTSHTLGFTLYLLAKNPAAQKKVQNEVDEVLGDGKGPLTESQLARLSYLKACVKESFRVFPITSGTGRFLDQDIVLSGYAIPKGYQVFIALMIPGWDEKYFKRANEYLPERWSRDRPLGNIHPYSTLPFSHGSRMCIGRRIAEQEMYTFLARTFHRYNIEYNYGNMDMKNCLIHKPSKPLKFKFTERIKNF